MPTDLQRLDGTRGHATRRVWCRATKTETDWRIDDLPRALQAGRVDLLDGGLPVDRTRGVGGPTAGDGDGFALVYMPTGNPLNPQAAQRLPLLVAANVVRNRLGIYVDGDGVPLRMPSTEAEPITEAKTSEVPVETTPTPSRLRKLAARIAGGAVML